MRDTGKHIYSIFIWFILVVPISLSIYVEIDNEKLFQTLYNSIVKIEKVPKNGEIEEVITRLNRAHENSLNSLVKIVPLVLDDKDKIANIKDKLTTLLVVEYKRVRAKNSLKKEYTLGINKEIEVLLIAVNDLEQTYKKSYSRWKQKIGKRHKTFMVVNLFLGGLVLLFLMRYVWINYYKYYFFEDKSR